MNPKTSSCFACMEVRWKRFTQEKYDKDENVYGIFYSIKELCDKGSIASAEKDPENNYVRLSTDTTDDLMSHMINECGLHEILEDALPYIPNKIFKDRPGAKLWDLLMEKSEGVMHLVYFYKTYQCNRPDDPPEWDSELKFVGFLDELYGEDIQFHMDAKGMHVRVARHSIDIATTGSTAPPDSKATMAGAAMRKWIRLDRGEWVPLRKWDMFQALNIIRSARDEDQLGRILTMLTHRIVRIPDKPGEKMEILEDTGVWINKEGDDDIPG